MRRTLSTVLSTILLVTSLLIPPQPALAEVPSTALADASPAAPAETPATDRQEILARLTALGLVKGRSDGDLALSGTLTRAELITILVRAFGAEEGAQEPSTSPAFADTAGHWADGAIQAALAIVERNGETLGYPDGSFHPDGTLTLAETIAFIMKFMGVKPEAGKPWPSSHMDAAVSAGLITPEVVDPERLTDPNQPILRGELFTIADTTFSTYELPSGKTVYTEYVDPEPPVVTLNPISPSADGTGIISGTASEGTYLYINGEMYWVDAGPFSFEVKLPEGTTSVDVRAVDLAGNTTRPEPPTPAEPPTTPEPPTPPVTPPSNPPAPPPAKQTTLLTTQAIEVGAGNWVELAATLTLQNGQPLSNQTIHFYVKGTLLLTASTDATGKAADYAQIILPVGTYTLEARFAGTSTLRSARATETLTVYPTPVASDMVVTTQQETSLEIPLTATDASGGPFIWFDPVPMPDQPLPAHGTIAKAPMPTCSTTGGVTSCTWPFTYTPDKGFLGTDTFYYFTSNQYGVSERLYTVTINVTPYEGPVALAASLPVLENTPTTITFAGLDVQGNPFTFAITDQPDHGTLGALSEPASCDPATGRCTVTATYTPAQGYNGPDSVSFSVSQGTYTSAPATVSLMVTPVNDPPVAQDLSVTTTEDESVDVKLTATDPEGSDVTFDLYSWPSHGTVTPGPTTCTEDGCEATFTYEPYPNYAGTDSFKYAAGDDEYSTTVKTVTVTVNPVEDPPIVPAVTKSVYKNRSVWFELEGDDPDGKDMTITLAPDAAPANGTVTFHNLNCFPNGSIYRRCWRTVEYKPNADFVGEDRFSFDVSDGTLTTRGTVTINVLDLPTAVSITYDMAEDGDAIPVTFSATDSEGRAISLQIGNPSHGTLTLPDELSCPAGISPCEVTGTYKPSADYNGQDWITYSAQASDLIGDAGTITISIRAVNDAPVANALTAELDEDTPSSFRLTATDVDGANLTYSWVDGEGPSHGAVSSLSGDQFTYTPHADHVGTDTFRYAVSDGSGTAEASITLTIKPVNDAPVAQDGSLTTDENTPKTVGLTATDVDLGNGTLTFSASASHGTVSDGTVACTGTSCTYTATYTPVQDYSGTDSISFTASDGALTSAAGTVSVTITPVNDAPTATATSGRVGQDRYGMIELSGSDPDSSSLSFAVVDAPQHGTVGTIDQTAVVCTPAGDGSNCTVQVSYTPAPGYLGDDSFTYTVSDGKRGSAPAEVTLSVVPRPVAEAATIDTDEDTPVTITFTATDTEKSHLLFGIDPATKGGTLSDLIGLFCNPLTGICTVSATYTPAPNYSGIDTISFRAADGLRDSDTATVTINIAPINDAPVPQAVTGTLAEDGSLTFDLAATDVEGDSLTYAWVIGEEPAHGSVSALAGATATYTPDPDHNGTDTFSFQVSDGTATAKGSVTLTITPTNDAPVAHAGSVTMNEDGTAVIELNATDIDGDHLTFDTPVIGNGTRTGSSVGCADKDGTWTCTYLLWYRPLEHYHGTDTVSFTARDGYASSTATVTITINSVVDDPIAIGGHINLPEDTQLGDLLVATDYEGQTMSFAWVQKPAHATVPDTLNPTCKGTLKGWSDCEVRFNLVPEKDYVGTDSYTYRVTTQDGRTSEATRTFDFWSVNDAPYSEVDQATFTITEDTPGQVTLTAWDVDSTDLNITDAHSDKGTLSNEVKQCSTTGGLTTCTFTYTYTPNPDASGPSWVQFTVSDGQYTANGRVIVQIGTP